MRYVRMVVNLLAFAFGAALFHACASVPRSETPQVVRDAALCLKSGTCTVLQVDNQNWNQATIYVQGSRFGQVEGKSQTPLFIPNWRLERGLCAAVTVKLLAAGSVWRSEQTCVRPGGWFSLTIFTQLQMTVFTQWGGT